MAKKGGNSHGKHLFGGDASTAYSSDIGKN
jgi:hypothetical protein